MLRRLLDDLFSPSNIWTLLQTVCPSVAALTSAWLSWVAKLPLSLTLCLALMTAASAFVLIAALRSHSVFQKFAMTYLHPLSWAFNTANQLGTVQLEAVFHNNHPYDTIYYIGELLHIVIQGRTHPNPNRIGGVNQIPPGGQQTFLFPAIDSIALGPANGRLHFRVRYGRRNNEKHLSKTLEMRLLLEGQSLIGAQGPVFALNYFIEQELHS